MSHAVIPENLVLRTVSPNPELKRARLSSYFSRFGSASAQLLAEFDEESTHYEAHIDGTSVGGFRVTPIGNGKSEAEALFPNWKFEKNSSELGRLWIRKDLRSSRLATEIFSLIFLRSTIFSGRTVYIKTAKEFERAISRFGFEWLEQEAWHPGLKYQSRLYVRYEKNYGVQSNEQV